MHLFIWSKSLDVCSANFQCMHVHAKAPHFKNKITKKQLKILATARLSPSKYEKKKSCNNAASFQTKKILTFNCQKYIFRLKSVWKIVS